MKTPVHALIAVLLAVMPILSGCESSDGDSNGEPANIIGTWSGPVFTPGSTPENGSVTISFNANGSFSTKDSWGGVTSGPYTVSGNSWSATARTPQGFVYSISGNISGDQLTIRVRETNSTGTLTRR
ncbi:MAG: hypothetical protein U1E27_08060 [Kiritimatiellia bacterium]|nr:hypothetical protein [Kiritimatiellia bacterium]